MSSALKDAIKIRLKRYFPFLLPLSDQVRKQGLASEPPRFQPKNDVMPDWRSVDLPADITAADTMLLRTEQQILLSLAKDYFKGEGCIIDAGCFLGGSTLPLAHGLKANPAAASFNQPVIHSYDLFIVEPWTIGIYFPKKTPLGTSFEDKFRANISPVSDMVKVNAGDVTQADIPDEDVEILFIDLAKHWTVSDYMVRTYFPKLIPGHSIVIQQDYLYHLWSGWLPVTMEVFADYFEILDHTSDGSVVFFYHTKIPDEMLNKDVFASLTRSEVLELANRAVARFSGKQKQVLIEARDQLQDVLKESNWPE